IELVGPWSVGHGRSIYVVSWSCHSRHAKALIEQHLSRSPSVSWRPERHGGLSADGIPTDPTPVVKPLRHRLSAVPCPAGVSTLSVWMGCLVWGRVRVSRDRR